MLKRIGAEESGEFKAIASGTLPSGKPVIVNADGTVSSVAQTSVSESLGSQTQFTGTSFGNTQMKDGTFDSANGKVVQVYYDINNSNYGTAVVGTVSGSSVTWGTPVVYNSATTLYNQAAFDSSNGKVVVGYRDTANSHRGTAIVGTVSGNSISFGSEVVFETSTTDWMSIVYHEAAQKIVISYRAVVSGYNRGRSVVGTVSGTSISFGSATQYSGGGQYVSSVYDPINEKVVLAYKSQNLSNFSSSNEAIVGTVSGTSISFGSGVQFLGGSGNANQVSIAYDTSSTKVVVTCKDEVNNTSGSAVVGTVSGTSISFGSVVTFQSGNVDFTSVIGFSKGGVVLVYDDQSTGTNQVVLKVGTVSGTSISFSSGTTLASGTTGGGYVGYSMDTTNDKLIMVYSVGGSSSYYRVYNPTYTSTNITSKNYIGISKGGAVANTKGATVDIIGAVNDEQSGLTAGQKYYVQTDGTIGTTAATPSVLAGTAISATELLVKT